MSGCWPVPLVGRKTAEGEIESATIKERHSDAEKVKRDAKVIYVLSKLRNVRNKQGTGLIQYLLSLWLTVPYLNNKCGKRTKQDKTYWFNCKVWYR